MINHCVFLLWSLLNQTSKGLVESPNCPALLSAVHAVIFIALLLLVPLFWTCSQSWFPPLSGCMIKSCFCLFLSFLLYQLQCYFSDCSSCFTSLGGIHIHSLLLPKWHRHVLVTLLAIKTNSLACRRSLSAMTTSSAAHPMTYPMPSHNVHADQVISCFRGRRRMSHRLGISLTQGQYFFWWTI